MAQSKSKLKSIAAAAGCSMSTVSRALNGQAVSATHRDSIIQAMDALNLGHYIQYKIGLILPETQNPFFPELAFAFEAEMEERDTHVLVSSAEGSLEREVTLVKRFLTLGVDGLVYVPTAQGSQALLTLIAETKMPVLVFDRRVANGNFDFVSVDSTVGTFRAIDHLIKFGHKKIGYLKGLENTFPAQERFDSFIDAMTRHGLAVNHRWIFRGDFTLKSGVAAAAKLLQLKSHDRPTAVLTANDCGAIGLMRRLQQAGWELPAELSVVGFDNIQWSGWTNPPLTTIAQPLKPMVKQASDALLARIAGSRKPRRRPLAVNSNSVEPTLLVRASVSKPHRK